MSQNNYGSQPNARVLYFGDVSVASVTNTQLDYVYQPTLDTSKIFQDASAFLLLTVDQGTLFPSGIGLVPVTASGFVTGANANGTTPVSTNHLRTRLEDPIGCAWNGVNGGDMPISVPISIDGVNSYTARLYTGSLATPLGGRTRTSFGEQILSLTATAIRHSPPSSLSSVFVNPTLVASGIVTNVATALATFLNTSAAQNEILKNLMYYDGRARVPITAASTKFDPSGSENLTLAFNLINLTVRVTSLNGVAWNVVLSKVPVFMALVSYISNRPLSLTDFPNTVALGVTWIDAASRKIGVGSDRLVLAGRTRGSTLIHDEARRYMYTFPSSTTLFTQVDTSFNVISLYRVANQGNEPNSASNGSTDNYTYPDIEIFSDNSMVVSFFYSNTQANVMNCRLINVLDGTVVSEYPAATGSGIVYTVIGNNGQKITDRILRNVEGSPLTTGYSGGIVADSLTKTYFYSVLSVNRDASLTSNTNTSLDNGPPLAAFPAVGVVPEATLRMIVKFDNRLKVMWSATMQPTLTNPTPTTDGGIFIGASRTTKGEIYYSNASLYLTLTPVGTTSNYIMRIPPRNDQFEITWFSRFGYATGSYTAEALSDVEATADGGVIALYRYPPSVAIGIWGPSGATLPNPTLTTPALPVAGSLAREATSIIKFTGSGVYSWINYIYADGFWNPNLLQAADGNAISAVMKMNRLFAVAMSDGGFVMSCFSWSDVPISDLPRVYAMNHSRTLFQRGSGQPVVAPVLRSFTTVNTVTGSGVALAGNGYITSYDSSGNLRWYQTICPSDSQVLNLSRQFAFPLVVIPSTDEMVGLSAYRGFKLIDASGRYLEQPQGVGQLIRISKNGFVVSQAGVYYNSANAAMGSENDQSVTLRVNNETYYYALEKGTYTASVALPGYHSSMCIYVPNGMSARFQDVSRVNLTILLQGPALFPASTAEVVPPTARFLQVSIDLPSEIVNPLLQPDPAIVMTKDPAWLSSRDLSGSWVTHYTPSGNAGLWTPRFVDVPIDIIIDMPGPNPVLGSFRFLADDTVVAIKLNGKSFEIPMPTFGSSNVLTTFVDPNFWLVKGRNVLQVTQRNNTLASGFIGVVTNFATGQVLGKTDANSRLTYFMYNLLMDPLENSPCFSHNLTPLPAVVSTNATPKGATFAAAYPYMKVPTAFNAFQAITKKYSFELTNPNLSHSLPVTLWISLDASGASRLQLRHDALGNAVFPGGLPNPLVGSTGVATSNNKFTIPYGTTTVSIDVSNNVLVRENALVLFVTRDTDNALIFASNPGNVMCTMAQPQLFQRLGAGPYARGALVTTLARTTFSFGSTTIGNATTASSVIPILITGHGTPALAPRTGANNETALAVGRNHRFVSIDDDCHTWGDNTYGQLGIEEIFPPIAMTASSMVVSGQVYGNGTYSVQASTALPLSTTTIDMAYGAFHYSEGASWTNAGNTYTSSGLYIGSVALVPGYSGEWVRINLPEAVRITRYDLFQRTGSTTRAPQILRVYGSLNAGASWVQVDDRTSVTYVSGMATHSVDFVHPSGYTSYAFAVNRLSGGNNSVVMIAKLYGSRVMANTPVSIKDMNNWAIKPVAQQLFPPAAMTSTTVTFSSPAVSYGYGSYTASGSSSQPFAANVVNLPYGAFDGSANTYWASASGLYNTANGLYTGTKGLVLGYSGEWITMQLPGPQGIYVTKVEVIANSASYAHAPGTYRIYGSTNGTTWVQLFDQPGRMTYSATSPLQSTLLAGPAPYLWIGMVVKTLAGNGVNECRTRLNIYGTRTRFASDQSSRLVTFRTVGCGGNDFTVGTIGRAGTGNVSEERVFAWGRNEFGALGNGTTESSYLPIDVSTYGSLNGRRINAVSAGLNHVLGLDDCGFVHAWGSNSHGQLGIGRFGDTLLTPSCIGQLYGSLASTRSIMIFAGPNNSYAIDISGNVNVWGDNDLGILGVSPFSAGAKQTTPAYPTTLGSLNGSKIYKGAAGDGFAVVLDISGRVHAWGRNGLGQCGQGSVTPAVITTPVLVNGLLTGQVMFHVNAGTATAYVMDNTHELYTWGQGSNGELGNGLTTNSLVPFRIGAFGSAGYVPPVLTPNYTYPQIALTASSMTMTGRAYGNGTYTARASAQATNEEAWGAFQFDLSAATGTNTGWGSNITYDNITGDYMGTVFTVVAGIGSVFGEWIDLKTPLGIAAPQVYMWPRSNFIARAPRSFMIAGSNDGTNFTELSSEINVSWQANTPYIIPLRNPTAYAYHRIIARTVSPFSGIASLAEIRYISSTFTA